MVSASADFDRLTCTAPALRVQPRRRHGVKVMLRVVIAGPAVNVSNSSSSSSAINRSTTDSESSAVTDALAAAFKSREPRTQTHVHELEFLYYLVPTIVAVTPRRVSLNGGVVLSVQLSPFPSILLIVNLLFRSNAAPRQSKPGPRLADVEGTSTITCCPMRGCAIRISLVN